MHTGLGLLSLALAASSDWAPLPNQRCHNDFSQTHAIPSLAQCEALCDATLPCRLVSYCPLAGAAGCANSTGGPQPGTCWLYPAAALPTCSSVQAAGWQSAHNLQPLPSPSPLPQPPADWAARVAAGQMAYSPLPPALIGEGFFPVLGNGFLAVEAGPFLQPFVNTWPWRDAGALKLSGVYNGANYSSPSHRAQLPQLTNCILLPVPGGTMEAIGTAMDYASAAFYNRTRIVGGVAGCAPGTVIEQRTYAHSLLREALVHELFAYSEAGDPAWAGCSLPVAWAPTPASPDAHLALTTTPTAAIFSGTTLLAEEAGLPLRALAMVLPAWLAAGPATLAFTPTAPRITSLAVLRSDLDVGSGQGANVTTPAAVAAAALATWQGYAQLSSQELWEGHTAALGALWASGGVEISGNASLAAVVNASLYDIAVETWMFPVLTVLFPALARSAAQYRLDRVGASLRNAASLNQSGAHWAWESASTGLWASPWREADYSEVHLDADIPLALRKLYYSTGDSALLARAWPLLNQTCTFWECRLTRSDTPAGAPAPPGSPSGCFSKLGVGNFTARRVITPDESSGVVDDSAYTNGAAAAALGFCVEAAAALGIDPGTLPGLWAEAAAAPHLPLSRTLYAAGPVHPQNTGYAGKVINQADVALLQYPLGLDFGAAQNARDLDYYAQRTDFSGMYTGDSAYACAYLALGNRSSADAQLSMTFGHISTEFNVFTETEITPGVPGLTPPTTTGTQHFITGSGGLLQALVFGYPALRIARLGVLSFASRSPLLPPLGVTALKLRGLHLLGAVFDASYNATAFCAQLQAPAPGVGSSGGSGAALELRVLATGARHPLALGEVCVAVQAVEVAGVGFL